jgi:hypothetical protein
MQNAQNNNEGQAEPEICQRKVIRVDRILKKLQENPGHPGLLHALITQINVEVAR